MEGCQAGKNSNEIQSIKIELESLVCEGSYDELEASLSKMSGIADVDVDRKMKTVFIDFDSSRLTPKEIENKIAECGCKNK